MTDQERIEREQEFHDRRFSASGTRKSSRFYAITERSNRAHHDQIARVPAEASVLELGCGDTGEVWNLANGRRRCVAIDISPVAVAAAQERAARENVEGTEFSVMNAEHLEFERDSFDAVIGTGILHHLDLDRVLPEVARVLKSTGTAIFLEPLGHNPAVNLYRRRTPTERTEDEHPLLRSDLNDLSRWFEGVELEFFHALSLAAIPFIKSKFFDRVLHGLEDADRRLLTSWTFAQNLAWIVTIRLSSPKVLKAHPL